MKLSVKQLIEQLSQFPENANVELQISQYNKVYPVVYLDFQELHGMCVQMRNGQDVRIMAQLPHDAEKYMGVVTKKRKVFINAE